MSGQSDQPAADKPHEPTAKKLQDARRKGEIARSADLNTAMGYAGFWVAALILGGASLTALGGLGAGLIGRADRLAPLMLSVAPQPPMGAVLMQAGTALAPWFALPMLAVLGAIAAQRSLVFAPSRLRPRLSRLSVLANAKQKFGRAGLFEFAKSATKLTLYAAVLGFYLAAHLNDMVALIGLDAGPASAAMLQLALGFLGVVVLISGGLGAVDVLWQRAEHHRRHRMTHEELKEEFKQAEGDPHMKQERRQRAMDLATNRMLADVPGADVVIVNPSHYAVVLAWERASTTPPVCVAKGVDAVAARIREIAAEAGVPMRRDPPTARALHATVEIGQPIPAEHFRAVAVAIRFAEDMRRRAGRAR